MDEFDAIINGQGFETPAHVFEYETVTLEKAPSGEEKHRQWALIAPDGSLAVLGPIGGGGKSTFIAYAAEHPGFRVANRKVVTMEWNVPKED